MIPGELFIDAGEHPLIGKRVAVKILNQRFASDPVMISRFIAEARAVNKIRQRNIIDIHHMLQGNVIGFVNFSKQLSK